MLLKGQGDILLCEYLSSSAIGFSVTFSAPDWAREGTCYLPRGQRGFPNFPVSRYL